MPPKKAANRRAGAVASSGSPSRRSTRLSPGLGGSALPNIPTKQSFAYGSSTTAILPHMLDAKPHKNLAEMADSIEDAVQTAKEREISSNSPSVNTRSRRESNAESTPPPRRPQRQPTPDEVQLQASLNEASSAAPSTPTRHSFSSDGSPPREVVAARLYPLIMQREASPTQVPVPFESHMHGDNSSVISYNAERDVHDDSLKRTRSNITAPPRRFSGLAFTQNTIEEEDEPTYQSPSRSRSAEQSIHEAPARTIIPNRSYVEPQPEEYQYESPRRPQTRWEDPGPKDAFVDWSLRLLMVAFTVVALYTFGPMVYNRSPFPSNGAIRFNNTDLDALSNQVVHLGSQVSSLSRDMRSVKAEINSIPVPTTVFQYPSGGRQDLAKTNFLSMGHGVIIDPYMTSPTVGRQLTSFQSFYMWLAGDKHMQPQPPLAALTSWEDFGECWCSAPRKGMSQLAILLGQRIIPEDVVVEHLPKAATIRPGVAPQEMELWARYRYVGKGARPYRWSVSSFLRGDPKNIAGQDALPSDRRILHGPVMEALRIAWRGEPDGAFSDDKLLGEDFYRIGKWRYDINESNNIQRFPVTAIIDSDEIRVDKVVFRVNSNWGGNETCIYRLKLHGKM